METTIFALRTGGQDRVHDITARCADFVREVAQGRDGLLHVFVPHATAGVAIMELGAGSDSDLLSVLADLVPADDRWRHSHGSRGHGRSHVLPAFVPPFAVLPVVDGSLALGTWQSIGVVDINADNPDRQVRLSFLASAIPGLATGLSR
jgi:secondary thiamine-phosphate synthase enzyme